MKKLLLAAFTALTLLSLNLVAMPKAAALFEGSRESACEAVNISETPQGCSDASGTTITNLIEKAISVLSIVVGVAAVIMLIIGGFKYVTSQGESANLNSARNTIIYALVGLVVAALAQFIVKFVLHKIS